MVNTANITAVITADDKASAVLKGFGSNVDKTAENSSSSLNKLSASFLAVTAATAGLVAFGTKSLSAFETQENATTRLKGALQNVTSATDKNVDGLLKQAAALQKVTRFSDEQVISAQGILATYQLNQEQIGLLTPRLIDMAEGMATVTGEMPNLEENAKLVAKAVGGEDTDSLVGVLRRANIMLTNHQQEVLKTGTFQERLTTITKVLDMNVGGLGTTMGKTTSGKMTEFKNQFNELEEAVGGVIAKGLTPLLDILNKHPAVLATVTIAVGTLVTAFVALKVASAISFIISGVATALGGLTVAASAAATAMTTLSLISIAGWGALIIGTLVAIGAAAFSVRDAFKAMGDEMRAEQGLQQSQVQVLQKLTDSANQGKISLVDLQKTEKALDLSPTVFKSAKTGNTYLPGYATGGFTGLGSSNDIAGVVHKGEYVLPQNMVDQNSGKPKIASSNISININAGAFLGNDVEARKFAQLIMKHYNDAMSSKSGMVMA